MSNLMFGTSDSDAATAYLEDGFEATAENGSDIKPTMTGNNSSSSNAKKIPTPTLLDVPQLIDDMVKGQGEIATMAAQRIYELCDVAHKHNRVPMVQSGNYNVLKALTQCLVQGLDNDHHHNNNNDDTSNHSAKNGSNAAGDASDDTNDANANDENKSTSQQQKQQAQEKKEDEKLHFVCLALNNLAIPDENKRVMALERGSKTLIGNLSRVIASGKREAYLCCIILMNLSFLDKTATKILQYSPKNSALSPTAAAAGNATTTTTTTPKSAATKVKLILLRGRAVPSPLENPHSLLRILQDLLAHAARGTADFRWAFGLLSHLSKHPDNAALIGQTAIPHVAIENIRTSTNPPLTWKENSLEDFSLSLLLYISSSCYHDATAAMSTAILFDKATAEAALEVLTPVMSHAEGQIQGIKATMICAFLEAPWSIFPKDGIPAAACLSELMGNMYEGVGKKGVYTRIMFSLPMATKAYGDLARAAAKADYDIKQKLLLEIKCQAEQEAQNGNAGPQPKETTAPTSNEENSAAAASVASGTPTTEQGWSMSSISSPSAAAAEHKMRASASNTKFVALPTSVALLFQIIGDVALTFSPDAEGPNDADGPGRADSRTAEYAVSALNALLPALLEAEDPPRQSRLTERACKQLQYLLTSYTRKGACSIPTKARAKEAAEKIGAASASGLPLLEAAYDLWVQAKSY
jgi:hypothetical protein